MAEIITSTEQEVLIEHMVDRLPALRKKYGISQERCRQIEANAEKKITEYLKRFE